MHDRKLITHNEEMVLAINFQKKRKTGIKKMIIKIRPKKVGSKLGKQDIIIIIIQYD